VESVGSRASASYARRAEIEVCMSCPLPVWTVLYWPVLDVDMVGEGRKSDARRARAGEGRM
jgi:hypothetical protein